MRTSPTAEIRRVELEGWSRSWMCFRIEWDSVVRDLVRWILFADCVYWSSPLAVSACRSRLSTPAPLPVDNHAFALLVGFGGSAPLSVCRCISSVFDIYESVM